MSIENSETRVAMYLLIRYHRRLLEAASSSFRLLDGLLAKVDGKPPCSDALHPEWIDVESLHAQAMIESGVRGTFSALWTIARRTVFFVALLGLVALAGLLSRLDSWVTPLAKQAEAYPVDQVPPVAIFAVFAAIIAALTLVGAALR